MRRLALLPLILLALLGAAQAAVAEEAEEADESALVEEAFEGCEEDAACEEEAGDEAEEEAEAESTYPPECTLRSAKAHAVARKSKLKLTIGYATSEPTKATIAVRYGSTPLGQFKRQLGRSGVLRFAKSLKATQTARRLVRVELDPEGGACPSRRLVLLPKG